VLRMLLIEEEARAPDLVPQPGAARRALIMGCEGEVLEQLLLMLDVMGWAADVVDPSAGLFNAPPALRPEVFHDTTDVSGLGQRADLGPDLLFLDSLQIAKAGFAINQSRTVVLLGRAPTHGRALFAGKTIIWLDMPLNIVKLERVIVNVA